MLLERSFPRRTGCWANWSSKMRALDQSRKFRDCCPRQPIQSSSSLNRAIAPEKYLCCFNATTRQAFHRSTFPRHAIADLKAALGAPPDSYSSPYFWPSLVSLRTLGELPSIFCMGSIFFVVQTEPLRFVHITSQSRSGAYRPEYTVHAHTDITLTHHTLSVPRRRRRGRQYETQGCAD